MKKNRMEIIIFALFGVTGIGLLVGGIFWMMSTVRFKENAAQITGVITEIERHRDTDGDVHHSVFVSYTYKDEYYEDVQLGYYSSGMRKGQEIELYCDRRHPEKVMAGGGVYFGPILLIGMGAVFALVGGIPICIILGKGKQRKMLMQTGKTLYAEVESVDINTSYTVNGRSPYVLYCHYLDPYSNITYRFKSDNLWTDPSPYFPQGSEVPVLVKDGDYSVYHVNVEQTMEARVVDYT